MKLRGDDTASAVLEWFKEEVKEAQASRHELGKFYFGVSTASMGVIVTIKKLEAPLKMDWTMGAAFVFLALSALIAMVMTSPKTWRLYEDTDLFDEYNKHVRENARFMWVWFLVWGLGTAAGIYSVLHN